MSALKIFLFLASSGIVVSRWLLRKKPNLSLVMLTLFTLGVGLVAQRAAEEAESTRVPRVSASQALEMVQSEGASLVDVRALPAFQVGHLRGAVNIPYTAAREGKYDLPRDRQVVVYCS